MANAKYAPASWFKDPLSAQALLSAGFIPAPKSEPVKPIEEKTPSVPQKPAAVPSEIKQPTDTRTDSKPVHTDPFTLISQKYIDDTKDKLKAEPESEPWLFHLDMPDYEYKPPKYYDPALKDYYDQNRSQDGFSETDLDKMKTDLEALSETYVIIENAYNNRFGETYYDVYHGDTENYKSELSRAKSMLDNMCLSLLNDSARLSAAGNKEQADSIRKHVQDIRHAVANMYSNAKSDSAYWTQFQNEEDYGAYSFQQDMLDKHEGRSFTALQGKIDDNYNMFASPYITGDMMSELDKENKWLDAYGLGIATSADYEKQIEINNTKIEALKQQKKNMTSLLVDEETSNRISMITEQINTLEAKNSQYEDEVFYKRNEELLGEMPEELKAGVMQIPYYEFDKIKAAENSYVSFEESEKAYAARQALDEKISAVKDRLRYAGYSEDEIEDLVSYANLTYNEEKYKKNIEEAEAYAKKHPVWASIKSVGENLMGGFGYIDILFQNAKNWLTGDDTPIDYYTPAMQFSGNASAARSTVAAGIDEAIDSDFLSEIATGFYQIGMSAADTVTAVYGLGLGNAATYVLAASSATNGIVSAKARGATDGQALLFGTLTGMSDLVLDDLPIGDLFKMGKSGVANAVKKVLSIQLKGASEEIVTTFANTFADAIVMGDKSELRLLISDYMTNDEMSEDDARARALGGLLKGLVWDAIGGAISSVVMKGASIGVGKIKADSQILSPVTVEGLIDLANKMDKQIEFCNAAQSGEFGLREPTLEEMAAISQRLNSHDSASLAKDSKDVRTRTPDTAPVSAWDDASVSAAQTDAKPAPSYPAAFQNSAPLQNSAAPSAMSNMHHAGTAYSPATSTSNSAPARNMAQGPIRQADVIPTGTTGNTATAAAPAPVQTATGYSVVPGAVQADTRVLPAAGALPDSAGITTPGLRTIPGTPTTPVAFAALTGPNASGIASPPGSVNLSLLPRLPDGRFDMPSIFAAYAQGRITASDFSAAMRENTQINSALTRSNEKQAQDTAFQKIMNLIGVGNNTGAKASQLANGTGKGYNGNVPDSQPNEGAGNGRVLWSGGKKAMDVAADFATKNGLKTLEQTVTGKLLTTCQNIAKRIFGEEKAYQLLSPLWDKASARFVRGADGVIHAFLNSQGISDTSVFMRIEYEIAKERGLKMVFHLVK
jgi:hypothetical protein